MNTDTYRILAQDCFINNNTFKTGINNNDLIIGPSGAGKTRGYVKPNIMQANESMIIADTKGNLLEEVGCILARRGYRLLNIDFKTMSSTCRYNPMEYIPYDESRGCYSSRDILKLAAGLIPIHDFHDPFWDLSARQYVALLISYILEFCPEEEHNLKYVMALFRTMGSEEFETRMNETRLYFPDSFCAQLYDEIQNNATAEKMHASIKGFVSEHLSDLVFDTALAMYEHETPFRIRELGQRKTALFLNISDTDRSLDTLVSLFYTQALQDLCDYADQECRGQRLPVPVRFFMDDFATNAYIEDFDKFISVIRSREISVSIIVQSITQLSSLYGQDRADTIIDNCDNLLYLGGHSLKTAEYMSVRSDIPEEEIINMPLDQAILCTRGQKPKMVKKFDIRTHERYSELPEAHEGFIISAEPQTVLQTEPL